MLTGHGHRSVQDPTKAGKASSGDPDSGGDGDTSGGTRRRHESDPDQRYDRSCTWEPGKPCWLSGDLEPWNQLLARGCFELSEHAWTELTISGFAWPELGQPRVSDLLRVSLLIHFLLRQHRCVKRVIIDFDISSLQDVMFWDAIKNGTAALTYLEFQLTKGCQVGEVPRAECIRWAESISTLRSLESLSISRVYFEGESAERLADFLQESSTITTLSMDNVEPVGDIPGTFLEALAMNRTLKKLRLCYTLLRARNGEALATFVRNHTAIESIEVTGVEHFSPSALLKAAVQSPSLRRLRINSCTIKAHDIEEMANDLTWPPVSPPACENLLPGPGSPSRSLQELGFYSCFGCDPAVEGAYASLIGGGLLSLTVSACFLRETFATAAALNLRNDTRLKKLDVKQNFIGVGALCEMVEAMQVNSSLGTLAFSVVGRQTTGVMDPFFNIICHLQVSSRLDISWNDPSGVDFAEGVKLCKTSSVFCELNRRATDDATVLLNAVASSRSIYKAKLECSYLMNHAVLQKLVDTLAATRFLRHLKLNTDLTGEDGDNLLNALARNDSIRVLKISNFTFDDSVMLPLGHLVRDNQCINFFTIAFTDDNEGAKQVRPICRMLSVSIPGNRALVSLEVKVGGYNYANDFAIKATLRRNMMNVHQAARFVNGCNERRAILAFKELQHSHSLTKVLTLDFNLPEEDALAKIRDARTRLAAISSSTPASSSTV
ncbi:uncharacterized protein LOC119372205 [Rhipicephalus sanguineus]|uniref:uncharacterized protein LOC119372205 n=1 Tax=Rhipicephalus sanguineus TaxID=34632 RepID=UPI0020C4A500|nr:uncharacterized protein LOC119372205 [Rhipicephalus sanguineus]